MSVTRLCEPSDEEVCAARELQSAVEAYIAAREISNAALAKALGLLPLGASNLRGKTWDLSTGWRVASALGMLPRVQVTPTK